MEINLSRDEISILLNSLCLSIDSEDEDGIFKDKFHLYTKLRGKLDEDTIKDKKELETCLISVKYEDNVYPKTFGGKAYTYYTTFDVEVGDLVIAPTKYEDKIAKIVAINVPEANVTMIKQYLKFISAKLNKEEYLQNDNIVEIQEAA